ncbi:PREDICTED: plasmalemma vesicle-associated protein [Elephantulus edwardii]|uniref:plasmalemma vesicle-associated protein n=1 Tax=Elephantulus edwardii TaxID=28737 RepID=UPI0003F0CFCE|nr:PREDICTED: plasmalemma vesicle-associated protein [Elephantulus edwardii]
MVLAMERGSPYTRPLHKSVGNEHSCWYYLRYFFLFVSLIQFLIILGLVLFMVYGNVHSGTESNLQATERRADSLYGQVMGLSATKTNLTKELNLTAKVRDSIMQSLLSARGELNRINASFRQCQAERVIHLNNERYMAAIILSEQECQEQLKGSNKSCNALVSTLSQKAKSLEENLAKEKGTCTKEKEMLTLGKRAAEDQLMECRKSQVQLQQEQRISDERVRKVEVMCLRFDKEKFEQELRTLWRDSIIPRTLDSISYPYHPLGSDVVSIRRSCDYLPTLMSTKVEELARSLRVDIEQVARENAELKRQKLEMERNLQALQEAKEKVEKEAQARESTMQTDHSRQMQALTEERTAMRKERDGLTKELEERKKEIEQLQMKLAVSASSLDTCIKAKTQGPLTVPKTVVSAPSNPPIDPASLEEFKKKILESQRTSVRTVVAPSR